MHDQRFQNWVAALVASGAGTLPDDKLSSVTRGAITYAEAEIRTATADLRMELDEKQQQVTRFANLLTEVRNACGAANFPAILDTIRAHGALGHDANDYPSGTPHADNVAMSAERARAAEPTVSELAAELGQPVEDVDALVDQLQTLDGADRVVTGEGTGDDPRLTTQAADVIRAQVRGGKQADRPVIAYRNPYGSLYCAEDGANRNLVPCTSEDLPDGGICTVCEVDVLITGDE